MSNKVIEDNAIQKIRKEQVIMDKAFYALIRRYEKNCKHEYYKRKMRIIDWGAVATIALDDYCFKLFQNDFHELLLYFKPHYKSP